MFIYSNTQLEQESDEDVDDELVIVGMEIEEDVDMLLTTQFDTSVNFPQPRSAFSGGEKHVVLMPDSGLARLYGDSRIEVYHSPPEVAECMLDANYLPDTIFGRESEPDVQERVFNFFELDNKGLGAKDEYRAQLREIAGMDEEEVEEDEVETGAERLVSDKKYSELQSEAKDLGIDDARQSKEELAEYIISERED